MSKKAKQSIQISSEIATAAEAIAKIKGEDIATKVEEYLQSYVMENMSVLIGQLNRQADKNEAVKDNGRPEN